MHTVRGDGVAGIKRCRCDLSGDGVRNLATTLGRGRLKEDLESSTWRRRQDFKATPCLFHKLQSEDPNQHLKDFLKLLDSLDLDGKNKERTHLRLFQFSLRDQASNWLERLPAGSITTWEDLTTRFLAQFFPPGRTTKLCNDILMFQQHHGESLSEAWTRFKDLLQKVPHHGIDLWLQVQIFYDHVTPVTRRTIDQSAGGKLRDRNAEESWALLEDLALYDNESWNDPRDFAKPVKAISLPQDVPSTSDRRLIELENQVQRLMEAHLAPMQPTQVNKITSSCEICSGPHDTFAMSSDDASSTITYTSVSFGSSEPSAWGIPLVNAGEIPNVNPYEEGAQHRQAHPLSPAYVSDPMELDEHPAAEDADSRGFLADSDSMEDDTDADSIDYPDEPEDGEDDDKDPEEDPSEEHESEDEEAKEDEPFEDSDETEPFEEDETAATPPSPGRRGERITVRPQPPMAASTQILIDAFDVGSPSFPSPPPINPTYDQAPLGYKEAITRMRDDIPEEDMLPQRRFVHTAPPPGCDIVESSAAAARASRSQYDFVDAVGTRQGLVSSPGHDARTITRAANRAEDVGYARALQASEHRMMTSIEEVNLRVSYQVQARKRESEDFYTQLLDARTDRRDIRLEVDVVRGQRTAYETELQEVRQAYLRSEAQNRALLARLETLETHMTRMEWQRQRAEDDAVRQIMRTHVLEARARIDTVEDTGSSC
ncbi:putative reverse transcriptase domain-containing protein [Tanacetum coccineum]